jgi:ComF family protein
MVDNQWVRVWSWLWPGRCRLCAAALAFGRELCPPCEAGLPMLHHACPRCASPLPPAADTGAACGRCQRHPPTFTGARALFRYEQPIDKLILRLKFHQELRLARLFGERLAARLCAPDVARPDLIVPVPLHSSRLRSRGYNQALELARPVARHLNIGLDAHGMRRVLPTRAQSDLSLLERRRNVRKAFRAARDYTGLSVAIVDDVMTSGSTAEAVARCLMKAGAKEVSVWVIARA